MRPQLLHRGNVLQAARHRTGIVTPSLMQTSMPAYPMAPACCLQISAAEEEVDRLIASKASAQAEADEADAAAQQALETGHAEVSPGWFWALARRCCMALACGARAG